MKHFKGTAADRKVLVRRLENLTGNRAVYTRMPRCAYMVGGYAVEKDGNLTMEMAEGCDAVIATLRGDGLIGEEMPAEGTGETQMPIIHVIQAKKPVTEVWQPERAAQSRMSALPNFSTSLDIPSAITGGLKDESVSEGVAAELPAELAAVGTEEFQAEAQEKPANPVAKAQTLTPTQPQPPFAFPLSSHTAASIINLVNTIYSRGRLISKAVGGDFHCEQSLAEELADSSPRTVGEAVSIIQSGNGIRGISFTEDSVIFSGFTNTGDEAHRESFQQFARQVNEACIRQGRVMAKEVDDTNERYSFRTWLNRLGMKGLEYKAARKHLMENLLGHTAFRTKEEEERAKERMLRGKLRQSGQKNAL